MQDLAITQLPYFVWQDLSIAALLRVIERQGVPGGFTSTTLSKLRKRQLRQDEVYEQAAGLFPMSKWLASQMIDDGIDPSKIRVLHPGANLVASNTWPEMQDRDSRRGERFLFVGRDFHRKGGDAVVKAFTALRTRRRHAQLVIVGPTSWPMRDPPPAGVIFLGRRSQTEVLAELMKADGFLMPSRFEAFGIAPAEALCCGVPPLVRNAFAMPEVVPRDLGVLVDGVGVDELVEGMESLLSESLVQRCRAAVFKSRQYWSWQRVADDVLASVDLVTNRG